MTTPGGLTPPAQGSPCLLIVATVGSTISQFLRPYALRMRTLGWRVEAAAASAPGEPGLEAAFDRVHDLPLSRSLRRPAGLLAGERAIARVIRDVAPDIVHVHTPIASFVTRVAVRLASADRRPSIIYTAHGFHFHRGGQPIANGIFLTAERVAGRWTDVLIVINDEDEQAARRHHIVPQGRLVRMHGIGVDTTALAPETWAPEAGAARVRVGVPPAAPMFVAIGELNDNKRQSDAIEALAICGHPTAHLVLLGAGPRRSALEALAVVRGVADRVHLAGQADDVPAILAGATALIASSAREGLSRSVMEALSLGIPVIASSARGNRELVTDSGIMVPTGDIAGIAAAMDALIGDPLAAARLGRIGRQRMIAGYDTRILLDQHERLYERVWSARAEAQRRV